MCGATETTLFLNTAKQALPTKIRSRKENVDIFKDLLMHNQINITQDLS